MTDVYRRRSRLTTGDKTGPFVMKSKDGEFLEIQRVSGQLKLCVVEHQNENITAPVVKICRRSLNDTKQVALQFPHESASYSLKVDKKSLVLESAVDGNPSDNIPNSCWFEKEDNGSGEHYCLRSVVEPSYSLYVRDKERYRIFSLSDDDSKSVLVTDKNKQ